MIDLIRKLLAGDRAYVAPSGVYFNVRSFAGYGALSRRTGSRSISGPDEAERDKRHHQDFALWKTARPGEPAWTSPWGSGRPGWHIECSAMAMRYLGVEFDMHAGGLALIFPHHENELAQARAASALTVGTGYITDV